MNGGGAKQNEGVHGQEWETEGGGGPEGERY